LVERSGESIAASVVVGEQPVVVLVPDSSLTVSVSLRLPIYGV